MSDESLLAEILAGVRENSKQLSSLRYEVATLRESVERQERRQDEADTNLATHAKFEEDFLKTVSEDLNKLTEGFPINPKTQRRDPVMHAQGHEEEYEVKADRKKAWGQIRTALVIAGAIAVLGFLWLLLVNGAKLELVRAINTPALESKK